MDWPALWGALGGGGAVSGGVALLKQALEKTDLKNKLEELETKTLPEIRAALAKLPELEKRVLDATTKLEGALARVRSAGRASTGSGDHGAAAAAELVALRREVDALKHPVDTVRQTQAATLPRLDALERRFEAFEENYREDYGELLEKVSGVAGEFRQAMRSRHDTRPSTESG
jgi:chromosome segregation ATPase